MDEKIEIITTYHKKPPRADGKNFKANSAFYFSNTKSFPAQRNFSSTEVSFK